MEPALLETNLEGLTLHRRGKVRDVYHVGDDLLILATDRISAFDVIMPTGIPDKGKILTQLSLYWFAATAHIIDNHVLSADVAEFPSSLTPHREVLELRSMLVRKTRTIPFECVVRGYLYGSGWEDYKKTGSVCGIGLPPGLQQADKLVEPIFTPATKAEAGHDINIGEEVLADQLGRELAEQLKTISLQLYQYGSSQAESKGIIIADTKFEFGLDGDRLILIDELMTPDSSRFWPAEQYRPGRSQPSYDKQFVRDYLNKLDWGKVPPGPELPDDVVSGTREKYRQAFRALTTMNRF